MRLAVFFRRRHFQSPDSGLQDSEQPYKKSFMNWQTFNFHGQISKLETVGVLLSQVNRDALIIVRVLRQKLNSCSDFNVLIIEKLDHPDHPLWFQWSQDVDLCSNELWLTLRAAPCVFRTRVSSFSSSSWIFTPDLRGYLFLILWDSSWKKRAFHTQLKFPFQLIRIMILWPIISYKIHLAIQRRSNILKKILLSSFYFYLYLSQPSRNTLSLAIGQSCWLAAIKIFGFNELIFSSVNKLKSSSATSRISFCTFSELMTKMMPRTELLNFWMALYRSRSAPGMSISWMVFESSSLYAAMFAP